MRAVLVVTAVLLVGACGLLPDKRVSVGPTIADLEPVTIEETPTVIHNLSLEALAAMYRDVLQYLRDPELALKIEHRLADIELASGEAKMGDMLASDDALGGAIDAYEALLRDHSHYEHRDRLLYQLAKAYDLRGDVDSALATLENLRETSPESPYVAEAHFRLAERHFVNAQYERAAQAYRRVIDEAIQTEFATRSHYMLGWSLFKLSRFTEALAAFTASLDAQLREATDDDSMLGQMSRAQVELLDDTLRVVALSFDSLGGVSAIEGAAVAHPGRHYEHRWYAALGDLYRDKERYAESAAVAERYLALHPDSKYAHNFALDAIESYSAGDFPQRLLVAKQDYVRRFAMASDHWRAADARVQTAIASNLNLFLEQLASHYHAVGQTRQEQDERRDALLRAVAYYRQWVESFPDSPDVASTRFLMAESLYEAGETESAIAMYAKVAYEHHADSHAPDAGFMTVQLYRELLEADPQNREDSMLVDESIAAGLRFAEHFSTDARALPVMGEAASQLLASAQHERAEAVANQLLASEQLRDDALKTSTYLVLGHSHFSQKEYGQAEQAYYGALALLEEDDERYAETQERVAAALYRQAEERQLAGDTHNAALLFARASKAAPGSDIGITALHDAAVAHRDAGDLATSVEYFQSLRSQQPDHALSRQVGAALLSNYEALEQWDDAAAELERMADGTSGPEALRQLQQLTAKYYDKAGDRARAIDRYRAYAHTWKQPLEPRMEVIFRLTELYGEADAADKRQFWLRKLEAAHEAAGDSVSARADYLAAFACSELASGVLRTYQSAELTLPLQRAFKVKRAAMDSALNALTRCGAYGVREFTTAAAFQIGEIYQQFSAALLHSQRPAGLDSLALEQYALMLEEQAFPFEEKAISVHEANVRRCQAEGVYDQWVKASFTALSKLVPALYAKPEMTTFTEMAARHEARSRGTRSERESLSSETAWHSRKMRERLESLNAKAIALRLEGEFEAARTTYLRALAFADDDPLTHHNLGILYELYLGKPARALEHYEQYDVLIGGTDRAVTGWIAQLKRNLMSLAGEV